MQVSAKVSSAKISFKHSMEVANFLRRKNLKAGKNFLKNLIDEKISLEGKYYTNVAKKFLEVLEAAEANAKQKNLNTEKLFIKNAKADKGLKYIRPKSRFKFRGRKAKITNITVEVEER